MADNVMTYNGMVLTFNNKVWNIDKTVVDIDGNIYNTVIIGSQEWTVQNLKTTRYRNGVDISTNYRWYSDNIGYKNPYGALYTWAAVDSSNMLAPNGWRVPNEADWGLLVTSLGGNVNTVGALLKEEGLAHWNAPNSGANNYSGFTGVGAGNYSAVFAELNTYGYFWSANEFSSTHVAVRILASGNTEFPANNNPKTAMFSVRLIKNI